MSAGAIVFATGRTGFTSSKESFALDRRAVGDGVGSGLKSGSSAGVLVVACVPGLLMRLGRVDWAWIAAAARRNIAPTLKNR